MRYPYVVERILDHHPDLKPGHIAHWLRLCSFVSLDKRYMYFQVAKAACTQMKELMRVVENASPLKVLIGGVWESRRDMHIHDRANVPLPSLVDLDNDTQRKVLESPNFFRMTVVRNPYKRLISAWRNRVLVCEPGESQDYRQIKGSLPDLRNKSFISFEQFVDYVESRCDLRTCNLHWRRQSDHIFFPALNFSHIGKVEKLGDTLRCFERHVGLSHSLVAGGRNVSAPVGSSFYTQELADRVYSLYKRDFDVFGYDRDSWPVSANNKSERSVGVPEEMFLDEVIERNLVILGLYEERDRLRAQLHRISRLHLFPVVNALASIRSMPRKFGRKVTQWARQTPEGVVNGKRGGVTPL